GRDELREDAPDLEAETVKQGSKGSRPRKAGPSRPPFQEVAPEELRTARLLGGVADLAVADDLRRRLEGNLFVEGAEELAEESDVGRTGRETERLESAARAHPPPVTSRKPGGELPTSSRARDETSRPGRSPASPRPDLLPAS